MKKTIILIIILSLILVGITAIVLALTLNSSNENMHEDLSYTHSFTKAICNLENLCQDYEFFCKNKEIIKTSPITGAVVQFSGAWKDPRNEEDKKTLC